MFTKHSLLLNLLFMSLILSSCAHQQNNVISKSSIPNRGIASIHPTCTTGYTDSDGDGYGWQNNATCIVPQGQQPPQNIALRTTACIDSDGDGYGWNGVETCIIGTGTTTPPPHTSQPVVTQPPLTPTTPVTAPPNPRNNSQVQTGQLLYSANFEPTKKQHANTNRCVRQDPRNPRAINYDSLYYAGDYLINANPWNASVTDYPYEQCIYEDSNPGWSFNWGGKNDFMSWGHVWDVRSYPEVIYGVKRGNTHGDFGEYSHGNSVTSTRERTGLPIPVQDIPNILIDLDYTASNSGDYNVSIESFFHSSCDNIITERGNSNMQYEIMLWLDIGQFKPAGKDGYVGDTTIDGIPVEVWTKDNNNLHYLTFVVKEGSRPITRRVINWSKFIDFAKSEGHQIRTTNKITNRPTNSLGGWNRRTLHNHYCLANILIGTEIWNGQGRFKLNKYQIRQYKR